MRALLTAILMLVAAPAWPEWVKVGETIEAVHYYDPTTVRRDGNFLKVWVLSDLKAPDTDGVRSRWVLAELDCKGKRYRVLSFRFHSGPMSSGEILQSNSESGNWRFTVLGTPVEATLGLVCAERGGQPAK